LPALFSQLSPDRLILSAELAPFAAPILHFPLLFDASCVFETPRAGGVASIGKACRKPSETPP
jgi:hypothetical protein